jgi:hypothetical protein
MNNLIIGETCLLSKQLRRIDIIDGPKNMFENVLINLDGLIKIIDNDFNYILDKNYLKFDNFPFYPEHNISYPKWNHKLYSVYNDLYSWPLYCPFFHNDAANDSDYESYARKILRTKKIFEDSSDTALFYYYRPHKKYNTVQIIDKFNFFIDKIILKYNKVFKIHLITKEDNLNTRNVKIDVLNDKLVHSHFISPNSWTGIDDNWDGHSDNVLFDEFKNSLSI